MSVSTPQPGHVLRRLILAAVLTAASQAWFAGAAAAQVELAPVKQGLEAPVLVTHAGDGTNRLFVVEQPGRIQVMDSEGTSLGVFIDLTDRVRFADERGLLGLAFHPAFPSNRRFFVNYSRLSDGATVVSEFTASAGDPDTADTQERVLLVIEQPFTNHNGGMIAFGPDGFLYISSGDGGSADDPGNRAQDAGLLLGKILRIDVDTTSGGSLPYGIPPTNPFVGDPAGRDEIYALGLRNPWRFSFDRLTGKLYAGDVGQNAVEEIDVVTLGGNYGWRVLEGSQCTGLDPSACSGSGFTAPIIEYANTGFSGRCSVTGGYVYRGGRQSLPDGAYIYGDFCSGEIFMWRGGETSVLPDTSLQLASFGEDERGELYAVDLGGSIHRIVNPAASITAYTIASGGGFSAATAGGSSAVRVGHARVAADSGGAPGGIAVFSFAPAGIVVSEASVEAAVPASSARLWVDVDGPVTTGLALANPTASTVPVSFFFTDSDGLDFGHGALSIPPGGHLARFLTEPPFDVEPGRAVSLTLDASAPIGFTALRGVTNERADFLITTVPVSTRAPIADTMRVIPQFATGGGWETELVVLNPTDDTMSGRLDFIGTSGAPAAVAVQGEAAPTASLRYTLPPRGARRFRTGSGAGAITSGSVRVTADAGSTLPEAFAIFSFRSGGTLLAEAGVTARPSAPAARLFVEGPGGFAAGAAGSIGTGLAAANPGEVAVPVTLELGGLDGVPIASPVTIQVPAGAQTAVFLHEIEGFASLGGSYRGVLRVSAASDLAVVGLRGRYNGRGDFIITTISPLDDGSAPVGGRVFAHFADGGGYTTQFVLVGSGGGASGVLALYGPDGNPSEVDPP